jgi:hypothetical protein
MLIEALSCLAFILFVPLVILYTRDIPSRISALLKIFWPLMVLFVVLHSMYYKTIILVPSFVIFLASILLIKEGLLQLQLIKWGKPLEGKWYKQNLDMNALSFWVKLSLVASGGISTYLIVLFSYFALVGNTHLTFAQIVSYAAALLVMSQKSGFLILDIFEMFNFRFFV